MMTCGNEFCGGGVKRRVFGGVDGRGLGWEERERKRTVQERRWVRGSDDSDELTIMDEEGEQEKKEEKEGGLAGGSGLCADECKRRKAGGFWRTFSVG